MIRRRLEETGRFDNLLILLEKNAEFEPRRMVACRVSHGRMPCLPWSHAVSPMVACRVSHGRIPSQNSGFRDRFRVGLARWRRWLSVIAAPLSTVTRSVSGSICQSATAPQDFNSSKAFRS